MARMAKDILDLVGGTPLVRINRLNKGDAEVYAKLEAANPGFCVKDRIAKQMIDDAIDYIPSADYIHSKIDEIKEQ